MSEDSEIQNLYTIVMVNIFCIAQVRNFRPHRPLAPDRGGSSTFSEKSCSKTKIVQLIKLLVFIHPRDLVGQGLRN